MKEHLFQMYNRRKGKTTKKHNLKEIVDRWDSKDKHKVEQEGIMKESKKKKRWKNRAIWERIILLMQYPL